jgi:hypothetical protein
LKEQVRILPVVLVANILQRELLCVIQGVGNLSKARRIHPRRGTGIVYILSASLVSSATTNSLSVRFPSLHPRTVVRGPVRCRKDLITGR